MTAAAAYAAARARLRATVLLLLDGAKAQLGSEGEAQLLQTIVAAKARGATTAIIAHRLSVLSVSDKILVLRDGRVEAFEERERLVARLQASSADPDAHTIQKRVANQ